MANKLKIVLCDIDGTVADITHREHLLKRDGKGRVNWKAFFALQEKDAVREHIKAMVYESWPDCEVVFLTGRPEDYREETEQWLADNGFTYRELHMRPFGDRRPDYIIKEEILLTKLDQYDIVIALEDREFVINMLRRNKIPVFDAGVDKRKELNL